jgi:uncharacterized protein YqjF (DUF2071 family)
MVRGPWLLRQSWQDLLFAHWRIDPPELAPLLPARVEPDLYDGSAWVSIVAFVMVGTRAALAPAWTQMRPIPELNVRTYVRARGLSAVWFLSLDASSPLFANLGRSLYGLRYRVSQMATANECGRIHYVAARRDAAFAATYGPSGPRFLARPGSVEHFLVERYRLFGERNGRLVTATVAHEPWPLRAAEARIEVNRMAPHGLAFRGAPLLHFAHAVDAGISVPTVLDARREGNLRRLRGVHAS